MDQSDRLTICIIFGAIIVVLLTFYVLIQDMRDSIKALEILLEVQ